MRAPWLLFSLVVGMVGCDSVTNDTASTDPTDHSDPTDGTDETDDTDVYDGDNARPDLYSQPELTAQEMRTWRYPALAVDLDGDELSWNVINGPSGLDISEWGLVEWTPPVGSIGEHDVTVQVTDGATPPVSQSFTITVVEGEQPPRITSVPPLTATPSSAYTYRATAVDPDQDPSTLSWSLTGPMSVDKNTGEVTWTPDAGAVGNFEAELTVTDETGRSASQAFSVGVARSGDSTQPSVSVNAPDTIEGWTDVRGTVQDEALAGYTVQLCTPDGRCRDLDPGLGPVDSGVITRINPHIVPDGDYTLVVTGTDAAGNTREVTDNVTIGGEKFGALKVAFNDLTVRRRGGSWTLTRVYDGFDATAEGGLGFGWRYGLDKKVSGASANVSISQPLHSGWSVYYHFSGNYIVEDVPHPIVLETTDGRVYRFKVELEHYPSSLDSLIPNGLRLSQDYGPTVRTFELLNKGKKAYPTTGYPMFGRKRGSGGAFEAFEDVSFTQLFEPAYIHIVTELGEDLLLDAETGELLEGTVMGDGADADGVTVDENAGEVRLDGEVLIELVKSGDRIVAARDPITLAQVSYTHDGNGDLIGATDVDGKAESYTYEGEHRLVSFDVEDRIPEQWWYDYTGRLVLYKAPTGQVSESVYFDDDKRVETTDASGAVSIAWYDDAGRTTRVQDALGNTSEMSYDATGNVKTFTDPLGRTTRYDYDGSGRRTRIVNPLGEATELDFATGQDVATGMTDGSGRQFREVMEGGAPSAYRLPDGTDAVRITYSGDTITYRDDMHEWSSTYDAYGNVTQTMEDGEKTEISFSSDGRTATVTDPDGTTTTTERDYRDRMIAVELEDGDLEYEYGPYGLKRVIGPDGSEQVWTHDKAGRLQSVSQDGEILQRRTYDANGRLASETNASTGTRTYKYDKLGAVVEVKHDGLTTALTRNGAGEITRVESDDGSWVAYDYDKAGRRVQESTATGTTEDWGFDASGRVDEYVDGEGRAHSLEYDSNGMLAKVTDPGGASTSWTYFRTHDMLDAEPVIKTITLPEGVSFAFDYTDGELSKITDQAGNETTFTDSPQEMTITDALSRRWAFQHRDDGLDLTWPSGGEESWDLYEDGSSWTRLDASTVRHERDGLVMEVSVDDTLFGTIDVSTPDVAREDVQETGEWLELELGSASRKVERVETDDGAVATLTYSADALLEGLTLTLPDATEHTVAYEYDADGRLEVLTDPDGDKTTYSYDDSGRVVGIERPNGVETEYVWSIYARPDEIIHRQGGAVIDAVEYGYDSRGRIMEETWDNGLEREYTYDFLGRLTEVTTYQSGALVDTQTTTWDAVGNRVSEETDAGVTTFSTNSDDQLTAADGAVQIDWTYSGRGAVESRTQGSDITDYAYDGLDRLSRVDLPDGSTVEYTYDMSGRLLSRTHSVDGALRFLPLPENLRGLPDVAAMYATDGSETQVVVHGAVGPSSVHGSQNAYYLHDAHGSVHSETDATGASATTSEYTPFGARTSTATPGSFGWLGEFQDPDTGLVFLRKRWYDPESGRFVTPDRYDAELTDPRTLHRYLYGLGDPLNRSDRTGDFSLIGMIGGMNVSTVMRGIKQAAIHCAKQVAISKIRAAAGQFLIGLIEDPLKSVLLGQLGLNPLKWKASLGEFDLDKYLNDTLCKKKTLAKGKNVEILSVEFQVKLDKDHCGGTDGGGSGCTAAAAVPGDNGIDIVMGGFIPVELKKNRISGGQGKGQLKRFCRYSSQKANVMFYVFLRFPTLNALNKYARACWTCWDRRWPGSKTNIKRKYLKTCPGTSSKRGAIFVGFAAFKQRKGQRGHNERYYVPGINSPFPCD